MRALRVEARRRFKRLLRCARVIAHAEAAREPRQLSARARCWCESRIANACMSIAFAAWNAPCFGLVGAMHVEERPMLKQTTMKFSHNKPGDTDFKGEGLREFFAYRDLGVAEATAGKVLAQLVRSQNAPEKGTGWHYHGAEFHIVYMLKGWARFMYEDKETLVEAGDCVHQRPGIVHYLFDYSPDMEYLEIVSPADFKSIDVDPVCEIPPSTPWE